MQTKPKLRAPITLALTLVLMSGAVLAFAQETTTVTTSLTAGSRVMTVTDLSGATLTELALTPGEPSAFKVSVTDTDVVATDGFNVDSELNNLYLNGDGTSTAKIPSSQVTLSFATSPVNALSTAVDLNPDYLLDGSVSCQSVLDLSSISLTSVTDPICNLLLNELSLGLTDPLSFLDQTLDATTIPNIDLSSLAPSALPIGITHGGDSGLSYDNPDCSNIGSTDTTCDDTTTAATALDYVVGTGLGATVTGALETLLESQLTATTLASIDGSATIGSMTQVITALQNSADANVSKLGNALTDAAYSDTNRLEIINTLMTATPDPTIDAVDLVDVVGTYNSFPMLTVDTSGVTTGGTYSGTLTVTLWP